ncbi:MAG: hypothetical protein KDA99_03550 [Planctomycetales bacterium]|nr:hypothetical protein [Planctomycetales bacterium]
MMNHTMETTPMTEDEKTTNRLRKLLTKTMLSTEEIAKRVGVSVDYVQSLIAEEFLEWMERTTGVHRVRYRRCKRHFCERCRSEKYLAPCPVCDVMSWFRTGKVRWSDRGEGRPEMLLDVPRGEALIKTE